MLRSERTYKPAFSHKKTYNILSVGDDHLIPTEHFEPRLLDILMAYHEELNQIRKRVED